MNTLQATLIRDCFNNGVDVHFVADHNDYELSAMNGRIGTLRVNDEQTFAVAGVQLVCGDSMLIIAMDGRSSGFCFTVDNIPGDEPVLWDDEDDSSFEYDGEEDVI